MRSEFKEPLEDFLLEGDEDYIGLWQIANRVSSAFHIDDTKFTVSDANKLWHGIQEFIVLMLENGFEVVYLAAEGKCDPWPDQNPEAVIEEIKRLWIKHKGDIQHSVWFNKIAR
jgi:hypothetical protein